MLDKGTDGRDFTLQTATKTKSARQERDWSLTKLTPFVIPAPEVAEPDSGATWANRGKRDPATARTGSTLRNYYDMQKAAHGAGSVQEKAAAVREDAVPDAAPKAKPRRSYAMTWEAYNKLSEDQRAAVDFNTLLVQAREKDLNTSYTETAGQRGAYEKSSDRIFGEDGGSDTYAPETLAVLEQVSYQGKDQDLDDFLGLKNAISLKELKNFSFKPSVSVPMPSAVESVTGAATADFVTPEQASAKGIEGLRESMAKSNALLHTFKASAAMFRNDDLQFFGGVPNEAKVRTGWGDSPAEGDIDSFFQDVFSALANKQGDETSTWASVHKTLTEPGEKQQLMKYLKAKAGEAENPDEFLSRLGLDDTTGGSYDSR